MNKQIRKLALIILSIVMIASLSSGCFDKRKKDFCILFTNDTHCSIDGELGFPELIAYRNSLIDKYNGEVMMIDCGDAV